MPSDDDFEAIRRYPAHFWGKADRARYSAYCLWKLRRDPIDPEPIGSDLGAAGAALFEAWLRESSVALELIVKAAFAQKEWQKPNPASVPSTHDIPQIWKMAGIAALSREDEYVLHTAFQALQWSGRYAAPRKGGKSMFDELHALKPIRDVEGGLPRLDWETFDRIFKVAQDAYFSHFRSS